MVLNHHTGVSISCQPEVGIQSDPLPDFATALDLSILSIDRLSHAWYTVMCYVTPCASCVTEDEDYPMAATSPFASPNEAGQSRAGMCDLPTGTVTLLFTDIEGSTHLLQQTGESYTNILAEHHQ